MKPSKKLLVASAVTLATLTTISAPALAEFRIGAQVGTTSTSGNESDDSVLAVGGSESGTSLGVFGQWRSSVSDTLDVGIHLGYSSDSAGSKTDFGGGIPLAGAIYDDVTLEVDIESTWDLMGVLAWKGGTVRPFMMAGLSTIKISGEAAGTERVSGNREKIDDSDSADGWKVAIGAEFPFGENWSGYAMIDYADYGEVDLEDKTLEFETEQTGIRLGVSYAF